MRFVFAFFTVLHNPIGSFTTNTFVDLMEVLVALSFIFSNKKKIRRYVQIKVVYRCIKLLYHRMISSEVNNADQRER